MAKATYLVTDMDLCPVSDVNGDYVEYKSEKAALEAAKEYLKAWTGDEVWIWRLSHIVSEPDVEPNVEKVS